MPFNNPVRPTVPRTTAQVLVGRPTCEAVFYRWSDPEAINIEKLKITSDQAGATSPDALKERGTSIMVVNNDIMNCTVTKSKASCAGSFRILLRAGRVGLDSDIKSKKEPIDYLKAVSVGDWCSIFIRKSSPEVDPTSNAQTSGLRMVGIVESVELTEMDDPSTGTPQQTFVIQGRDFGKIFESNLYFNPILDQSALSTQFGALFTESLNAIQAAKKENQLPTADSVMKALISFFFGGKFDNKHKEHETWYVPSSLAKLLGVNTKTKPKPSFIDILDYTTKVGLAKSGENATKPLNGRAIIIPALPVTGNIWSVMGYFANTLINEVFCDLAPDSNGRLRPTLFHRQLPFSMPTSSELYAFKKSKDSVSSDKKTFFLDLPRLTLNTSYIKARRIVCSDAERINHVVVAPRFVEEFKQAYHANYNVVSVQRYGLRTHTGETMYAADKENGATKYCEFCADLLSDWFFQAHMLYQGTIKVEGPDSHFHVGQNLYLADIGELYHIESYTIDYELIGKEAKPLYTVEFQLSRGIALNGQTARFIANANKSQHTATTVVKSILENDPLRGFKK